MVVDPCFEHIEQFRAGLQWCMMESKDFFQILVFLLKYKNADIISLNDIPIINTRSLILLKAFDINEITLSNTSQIQNTKKPEEQTKKPSLTPILQSFKQKVLSGNGFIVYEDSLRT